MIKNSGAVVVSQSLESLNILMCQAEALVGKFMS